jgi:hypothetical protein
MNITTPGLLFDQEDRLCYGDSASEALFDICKLDQSISLSLLDRPWLGDHS